MFTYPMTLGAPGTVLNSSKVSARTRGGEAAKRSPAEAGNALESQESRILSEIYV